ncbi:hypothetical protein [Natronobacterium texcoconense]|uniref:PIN domain-containing protein n=1 Tax=Natronobacterium texcoconense TaxID=1095778 RepID=A0A1H1G0N3_NATTX|nr:hypothetical protein [Natronobacterium texcoconense]SDR06468.1 hypothetical protein SAMN04489842_2191 [Natronobacterium texcoconense]
MEVARRHLTTVLNALYDAGKTSISVEHPCNTVGELFRIELEKRRRSTVRFTQGTISYRESRDAVRQQFGEDPYEDLPGHNEYVKAAVAGGLVEPENADEIETFLDRHTHPDLTAGHNPVMVAYDTNLFGFRLPEILDIDPVTGSTDDEGRPPTNGYALSGGVKEELDWYYNRFSTQTLEDAFGQEFARTKDQPAGANRIGVLGLYEFRNRMANRAVDIVPSDTGDDDIIDAYERYDKGNRKRVLLFSNDYEFVDNARAQDIWAQHVTFPVDLPRKVTASWTDIANTLYVMAVMFGVLTLPKVTLYGVWSGKRGLEWQQEQLDIDIRSPVVEPRLERDLALVEQFEEL